MGTEAPGVAARDARPGRLPLAIALLVVLALGISYYVYVRDQRGYFSSRNLRLLATVGEHLDDALGTHEGFVRNYANSRHTRSRYVRGSSPPGQTSLEDPATYLPGFFYADRECVAQSLTNAITPAAFTRSLDWYNGRAVLTIAYHETTAPLEWMAPPNWKEAAAPPPASTATQLPFESSPGLADLCRTAEGLTLARSATAQIHLDALLEPIFGDPLLAAFDDVMLARGDGTVIFTDHQHARTPLSSAGGEEESASEQIVTNLGQLLEKSGWRGDAKQLAIGTIRDATRISEVQTSSGTYYLFTQPFGHATVDRDTGAKEEGRRWIVAGLVSKRRFMYEVLSISASIILVVVALLLLMICGWPYLRVALIGQHQRITIADVLLLGFAALVHASILTLVVLDVLAYNSLRAISDKQMEILGANLEAKLEENLRSAVKTLNALDAWGTDPNAPERWKSNLLTDLAKDPTIDVSKLPNPYVSIVAWSDGQGLQRFKATMHDATPLVHVGRRNYFRDAKLNRLVQLDANPNEAFAIESIRSAASGETEAIIARRSAAKDLIVSGTVELVGITSAVLPPRFGFAIVDQSGNVVFHSEASRNNQENFFAETDWNRTVRSAVFARHSTLVNVRYWGADHRAYVRPLTKLPWTLIVFRDKSLLRTVNTECVAMTLSMLLGNSAIYLLVLLIILLWKPRYRAPQIWPIPANRVRYLRLIAMYSVTMAAALLTFYAFDARSALQVTMLVPAHALTATLLVLERRRTYLRWRAAFVVWLIATALWLVVLVLSAPMPGTRVADYQVAMVIAVSILVAVAAAITFHRTEYAFSPRHYRAIYVVAGVLLLCVTAAVPTFGFFKAASRLEIEGLVKYSQLHIANEAERAIVRTEDASSAARSVEQYCEAWTGDPFETRWHLYPPAGECKVVEEPGTPRLDEPWLPEIYRDVLPAYSEESVSLRQLHGMTQREGLWEWAWVNDVLELQKPIRLPDRRESAIELAGAGPRIYGGRASSPMIHVRSRVPLSFAEAWKRDAGWNSSRVIALIVFTLGVMAVIAVLFLIVRFFALKLFLIDVHEPLWLRPPPPLKPTLGDHVLLIRQAKSVEELTTAREEERLTPAQKREFVDVRFAELDANAKSSAWDDKLLEIDRAAEGQNVRVFDFEYRATDAGVSMRKLVFLERLFALPNRTVIIASTISPAVFLSLITNEDLRRRWTNVLDAYVWATESQFDIAPTGEVDGVERDNRDWLLAETDHGAFLQSLRRELEPLVENGAGREQLIDEIRERSNSYYAGLWASCSAKEKILLHQLAREGLMNGKDRKSVRRLLARGLVRRRPNLRIFNETFRLYVVAAAKREQVPIDSHEGPSTWDMIRLPLFVVVISVVILIFATQKDLLNLSTGLVAALTTGLPAIVRLFGFFTERRLNAAEKP